MVVIKTWFTSNQYSVLEWLKGEKKIEMLGTDKKFQELVRLDFW